MKRIAIVLSLVSMVGIEQFSHARHYVKPKNFATSYVTAIINNTYSPLIITSPEIKNGDIFITKNISLINGQVSIPLKPAGYRNALQIAPKTKSLIANLRIPATSVSMQNQSDYILRPNNYNPGTMHAICIDLPPQKFQLNYSIVHKPLPVIALSQKGNWLDIIRGDGLNSIDLNHKKILSPISSSMTPFLEKIENNATYTVKINQVKPIGHFQSIRHNSEDLSTMYLDGGAWVTPLHLNPNTLDISIRRNNISQDAVAVYDRNIRPHVFIQYFGVNKDGVAQAVIGSDQIHDEKDLQVLNNFFDTNDFMAQFASRGRPIVQALSGNFTRSYIFSVTISEKQFQKIIDDANRALNNSL